MKTAGKLLSGMAIVGLLYSCGITKKRGLGDGGGATSQTTDIDLRLPDREPLKAQVADIETKMNGYHLWIQPADESCSGATRVNKVGDYGAAKIDASLKQGCDYNIRLILGQKGGAPAPAPSPSADVSYDGKIKSLVDSNCVSCHSSSGSASFMPLTTYDEVKSQGARVVESVLAGRMPKAGPLGQPDKDAFTAWQSGGFAKSDGGSGNGERSTASTSSDKLAAQYYANNDMYTVKKGDIQGKASYTINIHLQLQRQGRDIGLRPDPGSNSNPNPIPNPNPDPAPAPGQSVSDKVNYSISDGSRSLKLSELWKGEYMLIDLSQPGCTPCRQAARRMEQMASLFASKCSHVTLTNSTRSLGEWKTFVANDFAARHSYAAEVGLGQVHFDLKNSRSYSTPTFFIVDRQGQVVAESLGTPPEGKLRELCQ